MGFMQTAGGDGEDFKVYVKYNAKAGRWYTKCEASQSVIAQKTPRDAA